MKGFKKAQFVHIIFVLILIILISIFTSCCTLIQPFTTSRDYPGTIAVGYEHINYAGKQYLFTRDGEHGIPYDVGLSSMKVAPGFKVTCFNQNKRDYVELTGSVPNFVDKRGVSGDAWVNDTTRSIVITDISNLPVNNRSYIDTKPQTTLQGYLIRRKIKKCDGTLRDADAKRNMDRYFNNDDAVELKHVNSFEPDHGEDCFGLEFTGWFTPPESGLYCVAVMSDDSADWSQYFNEKWNVLASAYGYKPIETLDQIKYVYTMYSTDQKIAVRFRYYEHTGDEAFRVIWQTPSNKNWTDVPFSVFSCDGTTPPTMSSRLRNFPDPKVSS